MEIKPFTKLKIDDTIILYDSIKYTSQILKIQIIDIIGTLWRGTTINDKGETKYITANKEDTRASYFGSMVFTSQEDFKLFIESEIVKTKNKYLDLIKLYKDKFESVLEFKDPKLKGQIFVVNGELQIIAFD